MISFIIFSNSVVRMCFATNKYFMYNYSSGMCSSLELSNATNKKNLMFKNPCLDLQQYLDIPLLKDKDVYFETSFEAMKASLEMFTPGAPHEENEIMYIKSTIHPKEFPDHSLPEIAFLGQSNSGKSSILKAIFNSMPELRITASKRPGHTKSLKFYQVGTKLCLVDMPGYGYRQPEWFKTSVIPYLSKRKNLVKTFLLIDCTRNFNSWDDASLQMLADLKISFAVILTKIDAVQDSGRLKSFLHVRNIINNFKINTCFPQIFMLSAHTYEGLAYFTSFIAHVTGNLNP